jgi:hypothetical protein
MTLSGFVVFCLVYALAVATPGPGVAAVLARSFGHGRGVHVAHVVIDGLIEGPKTDARFGPAVSGRIDAAAVARTYLHLALQEPSAWTHESAMARPSPTIATAASTSGHSTAAPGSSRPRHPRRFQLPIRAPKPWIPRLFFGALQGALLVKRTTGDQTQLRDVIEAIRAQLDA